MYRQQSAGRVTRPHSVPTRNCSGQREDYNKLSKHELGSIIVFTTGTFLFDVFLRKVFMLDLNINTICTFILVAYDTIKPLNGL